MEDMLKSRATLLLAAGAILILAAAVWFFRRDTPADDQAIATDVTVSVGTVQRMDIHDYVLGYGTIEAEPAQGGRPGGGAKLAAPVAKIVYAIPVREGQPVKAGDIIVRLDDRMTAAGVDKALEALELARQQYSRQQQLQAIGGTSQKALQIAQAQLSTARADLTYAQGALAQVRLTSPVDGTVARINVSPGQTVDANTVVAEVVDLNRLIVTVGIPAAQAANLQTGDVAQFARGESSAWTAHGRVSFVSPSVDSRTGTVLVRIGLSAGAGLRPGELVRTRLVSAVHPNALAVPFESVVGTDSAAVIHIVRGDTAYQVPVRVGPRDGNFVEITGNGIDAGEPVVTTGAYGLPEKTKISIGAP
jgi:membrane fusion protein (multidrug efflux system)